MRCEDIQTKVAAYALGELSPEESRRVQSHLRECAACRAVLARTDWLAAALSEAERPPVPAGLSARVMEAARARQRARTAADWNPFKWWRMTAAPLHAAVAIALAIGLTAGFYIGWTMLPGQDRAAPIQASTEADPLDLLNIDYLGDAPDDSLAGAYVALAAGRDAMPADRQGKGR